jgi:hypothetical protein
MTGIFFFGVVFLWGFLALRLARWATRRIQHTVLRKLAIGTVFSVLMVSLVIDELIGGVQFRALCEKNAVMHINEPLARNAVLTAKLVPSEYSKQYLSVPTTYIAAPIVIRESSYEFYVNGINDPVIAYKTYSAKGGRFIHLLGISEGNHPLVINPAYCAPQEQLHTVFSRLNVTTTNWK